MTTNLEQTAAVENALVHQKDGIIQALNACEDAADLELVLQRLAFVQRLWRALGYGYKVHEMIGRGIDRAGDLRAIALEDMAHPENRRRPAYRQKLAVQSRKLATIADAFNALRDA